MKKIIIFVLFISCLLPAAASLAAQKAGITIIPTTGKYTVGQTFTITVAINPNGESFDTARVNLTYPADLLEAKNFAFSPQFTFQSPENTIDNTNGILSYGAGVPGGLSQAGNFGTATFSVKKAGMANVSISSDSLVLAGGENIFSGSGASTLFALASPAPVPEVKPKAPVVKKETPAPAPKTEPEATPAPEPVNITPRLEANAVPIVAERTASMPFWYWIAAIIGLIALIVVGKMVAIFRKAKKRNGEFLRVIE